MTGIPTIDIIIGLAFVYLLFSLLVTVIQEIVATNFGFRAKILERAIVRMLEDEDQFNLRIGSIFSLFIKNNRKVGSGLSRQFYNHPLIKFLGEGKHHIKPSYIKKESFSKVAIDLLRGEWARPGDNINKLIQGDVEKFRIKRAMLMALADSLLNSDISKASESQFKTDSQISKIKRKG